jgi:hypothetical protein
MIPKKEDLLRQRNAELEELRRQLSIHLALRAEAEADSAEASSCSHAKQRKPKNSCTHALNALICATPERDGVALENIPQLPFTEIQLRVLRLLRAGISVDHAVRQVNISRSAFNNWMSRYDYFRRASIAVREQYREEVADDIEPLHNTVREWLEQWINDDGVPDTTRMRAISLFLRYINSPHLLPRRLEEMIPYTLQGAASNAPLASPSVETQSVASNPQETVQQEAAPSQETLKPRKEEANNSRKTAMQHDVEPTAPVLSTEDGPVPGLTAQQ